LGSMRPPDPGGVAGHRWPEMVEARCLHLAVWARTESDECGDRRSGA
jgi:hypothetical protein